MSKEVNNFEFISLLSYLLSILVFVILTCLCIYTFQLPIETISHIILGYSNLLIFSYFPYTVIYIIKTNRDKIQDVDLFKHLSNEDINISDNEDDDIEIIKGTIDNLYIDTYTFYDGNGRKVYLDYAYDIRMFEQAVNPCKAHDLHIRQHFKDHHCEFAYDDPNTYICKRVLPPKVYDEYLEVLREYEN